MIVVADQFDPAAEQSAAAVDVFPPRCHGRAEPTGCCPRADRSATGSTRYGLAPTWWAFPASSDTWPSAPREKLHFPGQGDTTGSAMFENDARDAGRCLLAPPITLPFAQHGKPGDRHRTGGDHAAHRHIVGLHRDAARRVGDDEDVISLAERLDRRHREADLGAEPGEHELPAPALLHDAGNFRVFPGVDERAVDRLLVRKDIPKLLDYIAAALLEHGGQDRRHVEDLRRLGEADDVVDDRRRLVAVQFGDLVGLMVD